MQIYSVYDHEDDLILMTEGKDRAEYELSENPYGYINLNSDGKLIEKWKVGSCFVLAVYDCIQDGQHLKSCDEDGFCNNCGYQDKTERDELIL